MSVLTDLSATSTDIRRIELARLLASGLIRVMLLNDTQPLQETTEMENSSDDGLEDS